MKCPKCGEKVKGNERKLAYEISYIAFAEGFMFKELGERGKLDHPALWGLGELKQRLLDELEK